MPSPNNNQGCVFDMPIIKDIHKIAQPLKADEEYLKKLAILEEADKRRLQEDMEEENSYITDSTMRMGYNSDSENSAILSISDDAFDSLFDDYISVSENNNNTNISLNATTPKSFQSEENTMNSQTEEILDPWILVTGKKRKKNPPAIKMKSINSNSHNKLITAIKYDVISKTNGILISNKPAKLYANKETISKFRSNSRKSDINTLSYGSKPVSANNGDKSIAKNKSLSTKNVITKNKEIPVSKKPCSSNVAKLSQNLGTARNRACNDRKRADILKTNSLQQESSNVFNVNEKEKEILTVKENLMDESFKTVKSSSKKVKKNKSNKDRLFPSTDSIKLTNYYESLNLDEDNIVQKEENAQESGGNGLKEDKNTENYEGDILEETKSSKNCESKQAAQQHEKQTLNIESQGASEESSALQSLQENMDIQKRPDDQLRLRKYLAKKSKKRKAYKKNFKIT